MGGGAGEAYLPGQAYLGRPTYRADAGVARAPGAAAAVHGGRPLASTTGPELPAARALPTGTPPPTHTPDRPTPPRRRRLAVNESRELTRMWTRRYLKEQLLVELAGEERAP